MTDYAPLIVFVYKRLDQTKQCLCSLNDNELAKETNLYIFSDASSNEKDSLLIGQVREYIASFKTNSNFKSVQLVMADKHRGLAQSVIHGVSEIIHDSGKAIVVEDDLVSQNNFLKYMNDCLNYYQKDSKIWSISGYTFPDMDLTNYPHDIYATYRGSSWGWATWEDRWETVDWDMKSQKTLWCNFSLLRKVKQAGHDLPMMLRNQKRGVIDSWAVRWVFQQCANEKITIYPKRTFIHNIGLDGSGTHNEASGNEDTKHLQANPYQLEYVQIDKTVNDKFLSHFQNPFVVEIKRRIGKVFGKGECA